MRSRGCGSSDGISDRRRQQRACLLFPSCEDTMRSWVFQPGRELSAGSDLAGICSWISRLQRCEKIHFCCLSRPVCDILLLEPKSANTICRLKVAILHTGNSLKTRKCLYTQCSRTLCGWISLCLVNQKCQIKFQKAMKNNRSLFRVP